MYKPVLPLCVAYKLLNGVMQVAAVCPFCLHTKMFLSTLDDNGINRNSLLILIDFLSYVVSFSPCFKYKNAANSLKWDGK